MAEIDDDAAFFARFSTEASNSAIDAIDDALAEATGGTRLDEAQKYQIAKLLLEAFKQVTAGGRLDDRARGAASSILTVLHQDEGDSDDLADEVRREVFRAIANFAEAMAAFYDAEIKRREEQQSAD